jgi:hypothetical protein
MMNTVTLQLSADTEQKLRERAERLGQTLEFYLQQLADMAAKNGPNPGADQWNSANRDSGAGESVNFSRLLSRPQLTSDRLEALIDELSAGSPGKVLPPDFSRADMYDDHD